MTNKEWLKENDFELNDKQFKYFERRIKNAYGDDLNRGATINMPVYRHDALAETLKRTRLQ